LWILWKSRTTPVTWFLERHSEYFSLYRIWTGEVNNVELIDHGEVNVTAP